MKTCRNCGASNSADDRFCGNCGAALPEADDQQPRAQGDQTFPAQPEAKSDQPPPYGQPGYGSPQPPYGSYGQQPSGTDQYGNPTSGQQSGQAPWGSPPFREPGNQPQAPYGQPGQDQYGQYPGYGQSAEGQYGQQQAYGQQQVGPQGQPYGAYGQQYGQQPQANPYGDQTPQPWYATGSAGDALPPVKRRGRSGLRTALLVIVAVFLLVCIGSIVFAVTPYGSNQVERLGTWAAEEQTQQAGE